MPHPVHDFVFVAALGRQVEVVVGADQDVEAAGVRGVGVEDVAGFVAIEDAQAGEFAFGGVGLFVVVGGFSSGCIFGFEANAEVVVEVAAFRRDPVEGPAHAALEGLEFGEGRAGDGDHGHVVVGQVLVGAVDVVGEEGAALAAFGPAGAEHEVVDDQLAAAAEQVGQAQFAVGALEAVGFVDFYPGQGAAFGAEFVPFAGEGFFVGQVLATGGEPFFPRDDWMILYVHGDFSCRQLLKSALHSLVVWPGVNSTGRWSAGAMGRPPTRLNGGVAPRSQPR